MPTIKVSESTLKKVKKIGKKQQINNGEFVDLAADFFIKTDLDLDADYSIKSEIVKQNKRLNDVIGFIRTHEKEHLIPIVAAVKQASKFVDNSSQVLHNYNKLYSPNRIQEVVLEVHEVLNDMNTTMAQNFSTDRAILQKRITELEARNKTSRHLQSSPTINVFEIDQGKGVLSREWNCFDPGISRCGETWFRTPH